MDLAKLRKEFPTADKQTWHRHPNGGGWVQNTAKVAATAMVGPDALVYGEAYVGDNALIFDYARVFGGARVCSRAEVYDDAIVCDRARICDQARVCGFAKVHGQAAVYDNVQIYGAAQVFDYAHIHDEVEIHGEASVHGRAWISGRTQVFDIAHVFGETRLTGGAWAKSPIQIQGSRDFVYEVSDTLIGIGCLRGDAKWWAEHVVQAGADHGYSPAEIEEYQMYLEIIARVRATRLAEAADRRAQFLPAADREGRVLGLPEGVIGDTIRAGE